MKEKLQQAELAVSQLTKNLNTRFYPQYHIAAKAGWVNDPNGLIYFNGQYHVFFQHHPYSAIWGPMHWGHLTSHDLISWQRQPIALAPTENDGDKDGCFSGSAVVTDEGELALIYTGHTWLAGFKNDDAVKEVQCLATSQDGIHFKKHGIIIEPPEGIMHFRDPKVWKQEGNWYMVVGVRTQQDVGEVWLYKSRDLHHWSLEQVLYRTTDPDTYMLECPDFFPLGNKWILMFSPQGMKAKGYHYRNIFQSGYLVGSWAPNQAFKIEKEFTEFDLGHDFYAPQTFLTKEGRRVLLGWQASPDAIIPTQEADNWSCQLTTFRELSLSNNLHLYALPVKEYQSLRTEHFHQSAITLNNEDILLDVDSHHCEIVIQLDRASSTAERFGLAVAVTPTDDETLIYIDDQSNRLIVDRSRSGLAGKGYRSAPLQDDNIVELQIFVDKDSIEVFVNKGRYCLSSLIFPNSSSRKISLFAENGSSVIPSLDIWQLDTIYQ